MQGRRPPECDHTPTLQVHVRHLVGGRARGSRALADERLYEVQAPERLRAISQLLDALSPVFNARPFSSEAVV